MCSSVALSTVSVLCNHHHRPPPELSPLAELKLCPHSTLTSGSHHSITSSYGFYCYNYLSCVQSHRDWPFVNGFIERVSQVHPCCSRHQNFLPFLRLNNSLIVWMCLGFCSSGSLHSCSSVSNQETDMATFYICYQFRSHARVCVCVCVCDPTCSFTPHGNCCQYHHSPGTSALSQAF